MAVVRDPVTGPFMIGFCQYCDVADGRLMIMLQARVQGLAGQGLEIMVSWLWPFCTGLCQVTQVLMMMTRDDPIVRYL